MKLRQNLHILSSLEPCCRSRNHHENSPVQTSNEQKIVMLVDLIVQYNRNKQVYMYLTCLIYIIY
jgi:hypothetical protein